MFKIVGSIDGLRRDSKNSMEIPIHVLVEFLSREKYVKFCERIFLYDSVQYCFLGINIILDTFESCVVHLDNT